MKITEESKVLTSARPVPLTVRTPEEKVEFAVPKELVLKLPADISDKVKVTV